jgi:hypothetical protein
MSGLRSKASTGCEYTLRLYRFRRLIKEAGPEGPAAQLQLDKLLKRIFETEGLRWSDLQAQWQARYTEIPQKHRPDEAGFRDAWDIPPDTPAAPPKPPPRDVNMLDLVVRIIEEYIYCLADERLAIALWILHTWFYSQYTKTPRLILTSVKEEAGKSTALKLCKRLVCTPRYYANVTEARLRNVINSHPTPTILLDEGDNAELPHKHELRTILNAGWDCDGGEVGRQIKEGKDFQTHFPAALGAIGKVPRPLLSRGINIVMHPAPAKFNLRRFRRQDDPALIRTRHLILTLAKN